MTSMPPPGQAERDGGWGYAASGGKTVDRPSAPRDPLTRRLLQAAAALSVLLIAVVANAVLHGGDENPLNPIAAAAQRTRELPGTRAVLEAIYTSPASSKRVVATGSEVYNARTGRSRAVLTVPSSRYGSERVEAVGDARTIYTRSRTISSGLPPGRAWMAVQPWLGKSTTTAIAGGGETEGDLGMLRATGEDFDSLGSEEVRGVTTHRYRSTIELSQYAGLLRDEGKRSTAEEYERLAEQMPEPIEAEVWIDTRGLVRQMRTVMTLPTGDSGPAITMDMRADFVRFGIHPHVQLPDRDRVFDATPLVEAQLHLMTVRSAARKVRIAGGPPLGAAAFHRRGNAICAGLLARVRELKRSGRTQLQAAEALGPGSSPDALLRAERGLADAILEPAIREGDATVRRLARLSPPARLADEYHRFLTLTALTLELTTAQTRALEVGEFHLNHTLSQQRKPLARQADRTARRLGFGSCVEE
jgi:hypothetical protein